MIEKKRDCEFGSHAFFILMDGGGGVVYGGDLYFMISN